MPEWMKEIINWIGALGIGTLIGIYIRYKFQRKEKIFETKLILA